MSRAFMGACLLLYAVPGPLTVEAQDTRPSRDTLMGLEPVPRRLPPVEVIGSVLPIAGPTVHSSVPARVSVVQREEIDSWGQRLLTDALRVQPGASLYDDLGSRYKPTLVTRGFTASPVVGVSQGVSVFIDGVPVNEPDAGQVNFDLLPLTHVQTVEFLSGTSALLGPYSLGGAVNLLTRHGADGTGGEFELTAGSRGLLGADLSHTGSSRGWSYYAGGGHERERGWRQFTSARRTNAFVRTGRFRDERGIGLQVFGARALAETAGSLPLSVYLTRPDSNLTAGDLEDLDQLHVALSGYAPLGRGRASANAYYRRHTAERFNVNQENDPDVRAFSANRTLGAAVDWRVARELGRGTAGLRAGAGGAANDASIRIFAERLQPGLTTHVESPVAKLDAYVLSDYRLRRLTISAGVRYDLVRIPFRNRLDSARDTVSNFTRLSPRLGASMDVAHGVSVYASAGQSFRAPAVIELACADPEEPCPLPFSLGDDPPLRPVVASTGEFGWQLARGALLLKASVYRTNVSDEIFLFPYQGDEPEGSTIDGFFGNVARTRREGVEAVSHVALAGGHSFTASYALTRATFRTSETEIFSVREHAGGENEIERGDRLPLIPRQTLALSGSVRLRRNVELGVSSAYTGARHLRGDEANEEPPLPGHWRTDARLGYSFARWEFVAVVRNALDRRYATFGTFNINQGAGGVVERFLTPGDPRSVQITLRRTFGTRTVTGADTLK